MKVNMSQTWADQRQHAPWYRTERFITMTVTWSRRYSLQHYKNARPYNERTLSSWEMNKRSSDLTRASESVSKRSSVARTCSASSSISTFRLHVATTVTCRAFIDICKLVTLGSLNIHHHILQHDVTTHAIHRQTHPVNISIEMLSYRQKS